MVQIMIGAVTGLLVAATAAASVFVAVAPDVAALTAEHDE